MVTSVADSTYELSMGFLPDSVAIPDPDRVGLLRAGPRAGAPYGGEGVVAQRCAAVDVAQPTTYVPDILDGGFDTVDLSSFEELQAACRRVRAAGCIGEVDAAIIRSALDGAELRTANGRRLTIVHLAAEGFLMRSGGPNRLKVVAGDSLGMNEHGPATSVHADQDVFGTPLVQLMDGKAPTVFFHDSPDAHNHSARVMLANLWIPLQQITQPLVFADGRSVDRLRQQLRYGLATESFLERDDDQRINDIWTFLYDPAQQWYFRSEMDHRLAYVFNTTSTPHGSGVLVGEDVAERYYTALAAAEDAVDAGRPDALTDALAPVAGLTPPTATTPALRRAIAAMATLVADAAQDPVATCGARAEQWLAASKNARSRVVRHSLELRVVVTIDD